MRSVDPLDTRSARLGALLAASLLTSSLSQAAPSFPDGTPETAPLPASEPRPHTSRALGPSWERDETSQQRGSKLRQAWLLSLEAVTHAPLDLGLQAGVETPFGLRVFGGYGWVPSAYSNLLTGIAASASSDPRAELLLNRAQYQGHTLRIQLGVRPFRNFGFYADAGYARLSVDSSLDLSDSGVPALAGLGGGYEARTDVDLWLFELGYQSEIKNRLVWALALGMVGTFDSRTRIASVRGAPTSSAVDEVAARGDAALESYGFLPTLTLRAGFDLL